MFDLKAETKILVSITAVVMVSYIKPLIPKINHRLEDFGGLTYIETFNPG